MLRGLAMLLALVMLGGCATGALLSAGRRREIVLEYSAATTDGRQLWLRYRAQTINGHDEPIGEGNRAAAVRLADLDATAGYTVESFPIERLDPPAAVAAGGTPVRLRIDRRNGAGADGDATTLRIDVSNGRHAGFTVEHLRGAPADARFYSGALERRYTAAWAYALFPVALAWDAWAVPALMPGLPLFLIFGD